MFEILQKVVYKHLGLEDIVDHVLNQMGEVKQIHLIGDYAKGLDSGKIEVLLVGNDLNNSYITSLEKKIQGIIERKVKFYIANKAIESSPALSCLENEIKKLFFRIFPSIQENKILLR